MKIFLTIITLLLTSSSFAIEFFTEKDKSPVIVSILSSESNNVGTQFGIDKDGVTRIRVSSKGYTYFNSAGAEVHSIELDSEEIKKLSLIVSRANECFVTLELDRANFEVIKVTSPCDEVR